MKKAKDKVHAYVRIEEKERIKFKGHLFGGPVSKALEQLVLEFNENETLRKKILKRIREVA